jgi:hypothetical protein
MKMPSPDGLVYNAERIGCGFHAFIFFKDVAMRWFNKTKQTEVWDEAIEWPIGDIEAAHKIREICRCAADSAEKIAAAADRSHRKISGEVERYERAAKVAMEIAIKISDNLLRDAAVRQIVELCLKANDSRTARPLFRAIQSQSIIADVLREHPSLRE